MEVIMPPKAKTTKEDIIKTALELVRSNGENALNARSIAAELGCSTQPIFSNFATMEELQSEIRSTAYEQYLGFLEREAQSGRYPHYKAFGMAYIRFAKEERELFKLLFMCDRGGKKMTPTLDFEASVKMIMQAGSFTKEKAELIHLEMWVFTHGIATMLATSFIDLDWTLIENMLTDVYQGIRARHVAEV